MTGGNMSEKIERKVDKRTIEKMKTRLGIESFTKESGLANMKICGHRMAMDALDLGTWGYLTKSVCKRGEFKEATKRTISDQGGPSYRTISECMKIAKFVADHPEFDLKKLRELGKTRLLMLASASDDEIDEEEGNVYGMTFDDLRARKIKDLEADRDAWRNKYDKSRSELRQGRDQLADAKEEIARLTDRNKLVGKGNKEMQKILDREFNCIHGSFEMVLGDLIKGKPGSLAGISPHQVSLINGWFTSVKDLWEEYGSLWAEQIRKV